jgi:hypothetical protein
MAKRSDMSDSRPWDDFSTLHFEFPLENRDARFKEVVLYVADRCVEDPTYSKIKLLKILFFSDFESYGKYGVPITGVPYRKMPFGPFAVDYPRLQQEMIRDRMVKVHSRKVHDYSSERLLPLQEPTFEFLQARDISIVESWIRRFWNITAKRISEYSHGKAWKITKDSALIPYEATFISDEPVTFEDVDKLKELATRFGWEL